VANDESRPGVTERPVSPAAVVLETKLTPPRIRAEHVPRSSLLGKLRPGGQCKLTVVTAPPGFGKTTLLAEWARSAAGPPVAWLSLDENDNDPARFFAYLAAAVQRVEPEFAGRAMVAMRGPGAVLPAVLPLLLNDLANLERGVVLVIEDYHVIDNSEIHGALGYLIERGPSDFGVVLSSREDPPLPLARLRPVASWSSSAPTSSASLMRRRQPS
jgi:LuxR family maltose regulon positive regulatory protein